MAVITQNKIRKNKIKLNVNVLKKYLVLLMYSVLSVPAFAENTRIESMHENGKIYPVIAVILVIFIGIIIFLIRQEK